MGDEVAPVDLEGWLSRFAEHVRGEQQGRARYVEWVASTRREANEVANRAGVHDDAPVHAVQVVGGRCRSARGGPRGSSGPAPGSVLALTVTQDTLRRATSDIRTASDLSRLGPVGSMSLAKSAGSGE